MDHNPRVVLVKGVQAQHDVECDDYSCACHGDHRKWHRDLQVYASDVAVAEADEIIAEIEDAAVRRYRGFEDV